MNKTAPAVAKPATGSEISQILGPSDGETVMGIARIRSIYRILQKDQERFDSSRGL